MKDDYSISFVVPVNDEEVFSSNFLASPLFKVHDEYEIIKQVGFKSAAKAYNDGIKKSSNGIIVFAHQDILFPDFWARELTRALVYLSANDPFWGVIGCYGHDRFGVGFGYMYCVGNKKMLGKLSQHPMPVQTLDEVVLIVNKSSGLHFDESLPHYHLYGADICMNAASKGKGCYAISAFCIHNTNKIPFLPREFFDCYDYIKEKWRCCLPIDTTCIRIEPFLTKEYFVYRYIRRLKFRLQVLRIGGKYMKKARYVDPVSLLLRLQRDTKLSWD